MLFEGADTRFSARISVGSVSRSADPPPSRTVKSNTSTSSARVSTIDDIVAGIESTPATMSEDADAAVTIKVLDVPFDTPAAAAWRLTPLSGVSYLRSDHEATPEVGALVRPLT